jgi:hypothetical protein
LIALQSEVKAICNTCANGFACMSTSEYFSCNAAGVPEPSKIATCTGATNVCIKSAAGAVTPCGATGRNPICAALPSNPIITDYDFWCAAKPVARYSNPNDATNLTYSKLANNLT